MNFFDTFSRETGLLTSVARAVEAVLVTQPGTEIQYAETPFTQGRTNISILSEYFLHTLTYSDIVDP